MNSPTKIVEFPLASIAKISNSCKVSGKEVSLVIGRYVHRPWYTDLPSSRSLIIQKDSIVQRFRLALSLDWVWEGMAGRLIDPFDGQWRENGCKSDDDDHTGINFITKNFADSP